jgi:hypothetical protein
MPKRRMIILGVAVAVAVSAVTIAVVATGRPEPACGCSMEPNLRGPAQDAAARFEARVRQADVPGAWALLTDGARARYVDMAGFQPAFDRIGKALGGSAASGVGSGTGTGWRAVHEQVRYDVPSQAVVVRFSTDPPRLVWPLLIVVPLGHLGDERVDPELPALRLTATGDGGGVRVELPDGDLSRTSFAVIDSTGLRTLPGRQPVTDAVVRLTWSIPPEGPILVIAVESGGTGLRVGSAGVVP